MVGLGFGLVQLMWPIDNLNNIDLIVRIWPTTGKAWSITMVQIPQ